MFESEPEPISASVLPPRWLMGRTAETGGGGRCCGRRREGAVTFGHFTSRFDSAEQLSASPGRRDCLARSRRRVSGLALRRSGSDTAIPLYGKALRWDGVQVVTVSICDRLSASEIVRSSTRRRQHGPGRGAQLWPRPPQSSCSGVHTLHHRAELPQSLCVPRVLFGSARGKTELVFCSHESFFFLPPPL